MTKYKAYEINIEELQLITDRLDKENLKYLIVEEINKGIYEFNKENNIEIPYKFNKIKDNNEE